MSTYKLTILGSGGVGKSSITIQLVKNHFIEEYDPTIEDTHRKRVVIDNEPCLLEILDTAGQEEFAELRDQYMRCSEGFLFIYSILSSSSFDEVKTFIELSLRVKDADQIPMIIVGNKCDNEEERQVTITKGQDLAKTYDCPFFESSAKARINIEESFYELVREIKKKRCTLSTNSKPEHKKKGCILL